MISDFRCWGRSFSYRIKAEDRLRMLQITLLEKMSNNGQKSSQRWKAHRLPVVISTRQKEEHYLWQGISHFWGNECRKPNSPQNEGFSVWNQVCNWVKCSIVGTLGDFWLFDGETEPREWVSLRQGKESRGFQTKAKLKVWRSAWAVTCIRKKDWPDWNRVHTRKQWNTGVSWVETTERPKEQAKEWILVKSS